MAEPVYSINSALSALEADIRHYVPTCSFYFGADELERNAGYPKVIWDVNGAEPATIDQRSGYPRAFAADFVEVSAICFGRGEPNPSDRDIRRAQWSATEHLASIVRWCVHRQWPGISKGAGYGGGWKVIWPDGPEDSAIGIEVTFSLHILLLAPSPPTVQPDTLVLTHEIEAT